MTVGEMVSLSIGCQVAVSAYLCRGRRSSSVSVSRSFAVVQV
jgi:hypothetical protein